MTDVVSKIRDLGVLPVIAIESAHHAVALADALLEGGLPVAEITFRTAAASEVLAILSDRRPELLVGAGTILDEATLAAALRSGARFALAPGFDPHLVQAGEASGLPFMPGVMTPGELGAALRSGVRVLKFFPAGLAGGVAALEGIGAPFAHLQPSFIPTGGVTEETMPDWLRLPSVMAVGGTWIARTADIREERWEAISTKARRAVARVRQARGG